MTKKEKYLNRIEKGFEIIKKCTLQGFVKMTKEDYKQCNDKNCKACRIFD